MMQYPPFPYRPPVPAAPVQNARTVWTDMDAERAQMSQEEFLFVLQDSEYQQADAALQTAFSAFLQAMFRDEFLQSDTQGLAEKKLLALKMARKEFSKQNDGILDDPEVRALIEKKRGEKRGN